MLGFCRSDILHIKAIQGLNYTRPYIKDRLESWLRHNKDSNHVVKFVEVHGTHHVQLSNPEKILPSIIQFLHRDRNINANDTGRLLWHEDINF